MAYRCPYTLDLEEWIMTQNSTVIIGNSGGPLIKVEIKGRDSDGKFTDEGEHHVSEGEFKTISLEPGASIQIFVEHQ